MTRAYSDYLRDILGMIDKAQQFVAGVEFSWYDIDTGNEEFGQ
jgi:uncharacterized protein with HEPN domain